MTTLHPAAIALAAAAEACAASLCDTSRSLAVLFTPALGPSPATVRVFRLADVALHGSDVVCVAKWRLPTLPHTVRRVALHRDDRAAVLIGDHTVTTLRFSTLFAQPPAVNTIQVTPRNSFPLVQCRWLPHGCALAILTQNGIFSLFNVTDECRTAATPDSHVEILGNDTLIARSAFGLDLDDFLFADFCFGSNPLELWDAFCCYCITNSGRVYLVGPCIPSEFFLTQTEFDIWRASFPALLSGELESPVPVDTLLQFANQIDTYANTSYSEYYFVNPNSASSQTLTVSEELLLSGDGSSLKSIFSVYAKANNKPKVYILTLHESGKFYVTDISSAVPATSNTNGILDLHSHPESDLPTFANVNTTFRECDSSNIIYSQTLDGVLVSCAGTVLYLSLDRIKEGFKTGKLLTKPIFRAASSVESISIVESIHVQPMLLSCLDDGDVEVTPLVTGLLKEVPLATTDVSNAYSILKSEYVIPPMLLTQGVQTTISDDFKNQTFSNITEEGLVAFSDAAKQIRSKIATLCDIGLQLSMRRLKQRQAVAALVRLQNNSLPLAIDDLQKCVQSSKIDNKVAAMDALVSKADSLLAELSKMSPALRPSEIQFAKSLNSVKEQVETLEKQLTRINDMLEKNMDAKVQIACVISANNLRRAQDALRTQSNIINRCVMDLQDVQI